MAGGFGAWMGQKTSAKQLKTWEGGDLSCANIDMNIVAKAEYNFGYSGNPVVRTSRIPKMFHHCTFLMIISY